MHRFNMPPNIFLDHFFFPKILARGTGGGVAETVNLDVHAINDLQTRGISTTNDLFKYNYTANKDGVYGKCDSI